MAKKSSGLGRGIDAIFLENTPDAVEKTSQIRISQIEPKIGQPRRNFDVDALEQLSASIKNHGVLQPILVREIADGRYQIIAGERRWRASKMAGLSEIPAIVLDGSEQEAAEIALIENVQREDLNPLEESLGYRALIEQYDFTQEELANRIGKSRSAIANALRLLDLPEALLSFLATGELTAGHARALLGLKDTDSMLELAARIIEKDLSVRVTEDEVRRMNKAPRALPTDDEDAANVVRINYAKELENRVMRALGRRCKISDGGRKKSITLFYEDNKDLENLLRDICGSDFGDDI